VAVAAIIVFAAVLASSGPSGQQYVIAAQALPAGSTIGPGELSTAKMSLPGGAGSDAFRQTGSLVGRMAAEAIRPGELLEQSMLVPVGSQPATRPVSVAVNPSSLAGLAPGSAVDVLATEGSGGSATVSLVIRGAVLIAVDNSASGGLTGSSTPVVTLGVGSLPEVEAVVQASQSGTVSLVAAEPSDGVGPGPSDGVGPGPSDGVGPGPSAGAGGGSSAGSSAAAGAGSSAGEASSGS
jgi:Flp pilus assembly protein CpaB